MIIVSILRSYHKLDNRRIEFAISGLNKCFIVDDHEKGGGLALF
jgi:hypothetical protein